MANKSRKPDNSLIEHITGNSTGYDFFQAVEMLQQMFPSKTPVGFDGPPKRECITFSPTAKFTFAQSEIANITVDPDADLHPADVETTFMSLYGRDGALPWHYTTQLRKEKKELQKEGMKKFLDIFNHRFISYFYRAGMKYRLPRHFTVDQDNQLFKHFASFAGLSTRGVSEAIPQVSHALYKYAGIFQQPRSADSLKMILEDMFNIPIEVEQFRGEWVTISHDARSAIGRMGRNNILGKSVCIGRKTWSTQHKFRLIIGALKYDHYKKVKPGTDTFRQMMDIIRFYVGNTLVFDIKYTISKWSIPRFQLGNRNLQLGGDLWLTYTNLGKSDEVVTRIHSVE